MHLQPLPWIEAAFQEHGLNAGLDFLIPQKDMQYFKYSKESTISHIALLWDDVKSAANVLEAHLLTKATDRFVIDRKHVAVRLERRILRNVIPPLICHKSPL